MARKIFNYKGVKVNAFGIPVDSSRIIPKNKRKKSFYNISFDSPFKKNSPKNLIVMYDVPSEMKKERDWFRRQLKNFGFIMIQKSVWVGPSPLPKTFLSYVKRIGLGDKFKILKLAKPYSDKSDLNIL